jgi:pimeloyl-ACP methyl ester carboxylesterase
VTLFGRDSRQGYAAGSIQRDHIGLPARLVDGRPEVAPMPIARINDHDMYYEVLGAGEPVLCMGGWGTFCHENHAHLARGLTERYQLIIFDYRGIRDSGDDPARPASMSLHAGDAIGLLDHLGLRRVHLIGLVGMGACICQEIAINRPDLARSMVNMGAWCEVDDFLRDQLEMFRWIHRDCGFPAFQQAVTLLSFTAEFYNANRARLLGPEGGWKELNGRYPAHARLIDACVGFESASRLGAVRCPTLIVHAGADQVTTPRHTRAIEAAIPGARGVLLEDVAHVVAGREQKQRFSRLLLEFLAEH